jgi:hypothetical protein
MVVQKPRNNKTKVFEGIRYARNDAELYKKAIELLNKCKIETRP